MGGRKLDKTFFLSVIEAEARDTVTKAYFAKNFNPIPPGLLEEIIQQGNLPKAADDVYRQYNTDERWGLARMTILFTANLSAFAVLVRDGNFTGTVVYTALVLALNAGLVGVAAVRK